MPITISTSMIAAQVNMTGRLCQTSAMLVPMAVKASVRSDSSIGMEKALMANANAANRPPTALPISNIAQPTSVVNSMGMMRSRPGKGRRPKNSAYTMTAARIHNSVSRKSSTPANRTWPPDSGLTKTICHRLTDLPSAMRRLFSYSPIPMIGPTTMKPANAGSRM